MREAPHMCPEVMVFVARRCVAHRAFDRVSRVGNESAVNERVGGLWFRQGGLMARDDHCVFCSIVAGELESSPVYEDDDVIAFMDLQPVTTGHVLVVPKEHRPSLADVGEALGTAVFRAGQRVAAALRASDVPCEGINLFLADGEAAFQEVFHLHLHVFPRTTGDGFRISADWRVRPRSELDAVAVRVRAGLQRR